MARRISARTRVKLSQAAKKRHRGLKGTSLGGQFAKGAGNAMHGKPLPAARIRPGDIPAGDPNRHINGPAGVESRALLSQSEKHYDSKGNIELQGKTGNKYRKPQRDEAISRQTAVAMSRAEAQRLVQKSHHDPNAEAKLVEEVTRGRAARTMGMKPTAKGKKGGKLVGYTPDDFSDADLVRARLSVTSLDTADLKRSTRAGKWKDRAVYDKPNKGYISTSKFIKSEMPDDHASWLHGQLTNSHSPFNQGLVPGRSNRKDVMSAGAGNRLDTYVRRLQDGMSSADAIEYLKQEHRGGGGLTPKRGPGRGQMMLDERGAARGMRSKTQSLAPTNKEFKYGIETPNVDTTDSIRKRFPGLSADDYVKIQQAQRETIFDTINKNQKWTHETKRANYLGGKADSNHGPDRVVFFTTSLGGPSPSVPSDSLVGQYIIKRRKQVLRNDRIATPAELSGRFPQAVRDMHIVELSTGVSAGAEGRYGVFSKGGWRAGTKKSKGFGKPKPIGASILYDQSGRPMYDGEGNIRYSEGLTRKFTAGTEKDVGLRIFIG